MVMNSENAKISPFADIEQSTKGSKFIIGSGSTIDSFVKVKFVGGVGDIIIGKNSYINAGCVIYSGNGILIGNDVLIAANCTLAPVNHEYRSKGKTIHEQRFMPSKGGIIIEDDVWIGANTVIVDGAIIRKGCVIGAHSLVANQLECFGVYVGSPLRKIGERN